MNGTGNRHLITTERTAGTPYLLVVCTALLFEGMSLSSINIQVAPIQRTFHPTGGALQLIASVFLMTYAGLLLLGGRWADRYGARRVFLVGVSIFGCASLAAALATGVPMLIAARAVQGAGAALTAPAAFALIAHGFAAGHERNRAMGVLSAVGAAGFSLGVVGGGLLTDLAGWRWSFGCYVPLAAIVAAVAHRVLIETPRSGAPVAWRKGLVATAGLIVLVYGIGEFGSSVTVATVATTAGVVLTVVGFYGTRVQADRRLAAACVALGGGFAACAGTLFLVGTALQSDHGWSPLRTGLAFLPQGLAVGVFSVPAARLVNRRPPAYVLAGGMLVLVAGQLVYVSVLGHGYVTHFLPACLLVGGAIAVAYPAAAIMASSSAQPAAQATAAGLLTTSQQAGSAIGVAVISSVGGTGGLWTAAAIAAAAAVVTTMLAPNHR